ncbi:MAG: hypothetical protein FWC89_00230 [Defluviitaleaceae bacterium]|nr:hypothetical protein [Defluviitaleaceae bacterium]
MSDYFKYKYLANNRFYQKIIEGYSYGQAGDMCLGWTTITFESKKKEALKYTVYYSHILAKLSLYKMGEETFKLENFKSDYESMLKLYDSVPIDALLNEEELRHFNEDMAIVKETFEAL